MFYMYISEKLRKLAWMPKMMVWNVYMLKISGAYQLMKQFNAKI